MQDARPLVLPASIESNRRTLYSLIGWIARYGTRLASYGLRVSAQMWRPQLPSIIPVCTDIEASTALSRAVDRSVEG